jgi:hypothetical protein
MNCFLFELSRFRRDRVPFLLWLSLVVVGVALSSLELLGGGVTILAPYFAAYLAGSDTAEGLRRGAWDLLVSRGPSLRQWLFARFALAVVASLLLLGAHAGAALVRGELPLSQLAQLVTTILYWAGVGLFLGFWLSGAAILVLALLGTVFSTWWLTTGCIVLAKVPAAQLPELSKAIVAFLGGWSPGSVHSYLGPSGWEWEVLRLLVWLGMLSWTFWYAGRLPLFAKETS